MPHWSDVLRLSDDEGTPVCITAAGTFPADKVGHLPEWAKGGSPGTMTIPESALDEMIQSFDEKDLGTDVIMDDGHHAEDKASGIFKRLWKDTFKAPDGTEHVGLFGSVDWTSLGKQLIGDKQYGYSSAVMGPVGKGGRFMLRSVTPTNKPVLRILPRLALEEARIEGELGADAAIALAEIEPEAMLALSEVDFVELAHQQAMASVGGELHPASDFAYTPDLSKPGSWKFPVFDRGHAANAAARFNQAAIPEADLPAVRRKIAAAHRKFMPDTPLPDVLRAEEDDKQAEGVQPMPDDKQALELAEKNAADLEAQTLELAEVRAQVATEQKRLRGISLTADAKVARALPYDAATIQKVIELSEATYDETIKLAEDGPDVRVFDAVVDIMSKAVPVVHTKALGFKEFEKSDETKPGTISLEESKKIIAEQYKNDPAKRDAIIARLEEEGKA
jgi:hypothetical protein